MLLTSSTESFKSGLASYAQLDAPRPQQQRVPSPSKSSKSARTPKPAASAGHVRLALPIAAFSPPAVPPNAAKGPGEHWQEPT